MVEKTRKSYNPTCSEERRKRKTRIQKKRKRNLNRSFLYNQFPFFVLAFNRAFFFDKLGSFVRSLKIFQHFHPLFLRIFLNTFFFPLLSFPQKKVRPTWVTKTMIKYPIWFQSKHLFVIVEIFSFFSLLTFSPNHPVRFYYQNIHHNSRSDSLLVLSNSSTSLTAIE